MIVHLNGELIEKDIGRVVVECGGVGYGAQIPVSTFDRLPAVGGAVKLFTHHEVREDAQILFGFATRAERDAFELMTTVSGVGPRLALSILSGLTVGDLQLAISQGDSKRLASVKGVGKKTAERIVVELRDKINPIEALANSTAASSQRQSNVLRDAMLALTALGFGEDVARAKVQAVLEADCAVSDTETVVRRALKG
ncbi:MAG: Holliday junction branch migration protein RuvA [Kiritimatiellia bacterium]